MAMPYFFASCSCERCKTQISCSSIRRSLSHALLQSASKSCTCLRKTRNSSPAHLASASKSSACAVSSACLQATSASRALASPCCNASKAASKFACSSVRLRMSSVRRPASLKLRDATASFLSDSRAGSCSRTASIWLRSFADSASWPAELSASRETSRMASSHFKRACFSVSRCGSNSRCQADRMRTPRAVKRLSPRSLRDSLCISEISRLRNCVLSKQTCRSRSSSAAVCSTCWESCSTSFRASSRRRCLSSKRVSCFSNLDLMLAMRISAESTTSVRALRSSSFLSRDLWSSWISPSTSAL
mmetsp:Transcript_79641/g.220266  ORF Transcript_79641/g.220266 Transcript_79641/m.220266 type:complete len:304 (-) Transcript_79641:704-1615(-)